SAKCLRLKVLLLMMLLLPPVSCTKPVMVPLLMMPVLLLGKSGLLATARSDKAPMLPLLVRVALPPADPSTTPGEGRPPKFPKGAGPEGSVPTPARSACQPPITDPPGVMLTITLPPGAPVAGIPVLVAFIPALNRPVVDTLVALTCTGPVVEAAQMPCATSPRVEIAPDAVTI